MRLLIQSIIFSIAVHVLYFGGNIVHGWYLTRNYVPDIGNAYENVYNLQNEVAIGYVLRSPIYYVFTFTLTILIGALFIQLFKKLRTVNKSY